jgi:hypothetical protein
MARVSGGPVNSAVMLLRGIMKTFFSKAMLLIVICFTSCGRSPNEVSRNVSPSTTVPRNSAPQTENKAKRDYPTVVVTDNWQVPGLEGSTIIERVNESERGRSMVPPEYRNPTLQPSKPDPVYVTWYKLNVPKGRGRAYVIEDTFFTQKQWQIVRKALAAPSGRLAVVEIVKYDKAERFSYVVHVQIEGRGLHTHPYSGNYPLSVGRWQGKKNYPVSARKLSQSLAVWSMIGSCERNSPRPTKATTVKSQSTHTSKAARPSACPIKSRLPPMSLRAF